jgi:ribonuclease H2 subunit A
MLQDKLSQRFPGIKFVVCPKADALFPIVSAASIVAKVTRDRLLKEYRPIEDVETSTEYGCGYPGDAVTKQWLEDHINRVFGFPSLVRFSWSTCDPLLKENCVPVKWECEEGDPAQQTLNFGGASQKKVVASSGAGRHSYFRARRLQRVTAGF